MNFDRLKKISEESGYSNLNLKPGQYIELSEQIGEGTNKRIWKFKGVILKVKRKGLHDGTFTIRGKSTGNTIEKIYPLSYTGFQKVVVLDQYKVRRSKLYYLRNKIGKQAKLKSISPSNKGVNLLEK
ncbi:50S ribosomal protein L19 [Candidatus Vampirococcus lugosii]|uniref:50S ribosomal protein L19 n=1 Tax=Candidatus Vampirococcus lugosii TaxID=2789015 RepID=A0ABS5QNG8_9BACT|nr:50S ribosomal protein L19 [Candidatus Vampirococcus lugosii]MBS8121984.1 50S ribosomal protein L19 [Candidatus Vampirococcus lugosii]